MALEIVKEGRHRRVHVMLFYNGDRNLNSCCLCGRGAID